MKPIKIGILGAGGFSCAFIPLFQAHPLMDDVYLAEIIPERLANAVDRFKIKRSYTDLEGLLNSDVDAVAISSQRWMHAPQAITACSRR